MQINMAIWQTILSSLDPKRKDIKIIHEQGKEENFYYTDDAKSMYKVYSYENYTVNNQANQTIFQYNVTFLGPIRNYPEGSIEAKQCPIVYVPSFSYTLKINDVITSYNVKEARDEISLINFVPILNKALKEKLSAQKYDEECKESIKNMSVKEIEILKYLENTIKR